MGYIYRYIRVEAKILEISPGCIHHIYALAWCSFFSGLYMVYTYYYCTERMPLGLDPARFPWISRVSTRYMSGWYGCSSDVDVVFI
jgi:hypothetical protein